MNSTERHEARYQRRKAARIEKKAKALKEFGDFGAVFSFDHLYASYRASIKGVGWKASTQRYKSSALAHIAKTQEELLTGKYRSRGFYEFDLVERGKPRHIRSVHISERVVQRCLCDYCLVPALSKSFIYDNGASLPGKGYDFAVSRVTRFLADHYRRYISASRTTILLGIAAHPAHTFTRDAGMKTVSALKSDHISWTNLRRVPQRPQIGISRRRSWTTLLYSHKC